jgi:NAD(P)-dependent dehydrogenase (short-subunit alcohol dehydrogenase family)
MTILPLDVDSDRSVSEAFEEAERQCGPIEVLVNNAGIGQGYAVEDGSLDHFRQTMETNFFGALRCIKRVLPGMRERRRGCIVNVTSIAGRIAATPQAAYSASKFALEALSEVLAQEVRPFGVRVAIVEPGIIATPILSKINTPGETPYPGARRIAALFAASLAARQVQPKLVGEAIREIIGNDSLKLRHTVGPDAEPFLAWRRGMSDEAWIEWAAIKDDETWALRVERDFGLDVRPYFGHVPHGIVGA